MALRSNEKYYDYSVYYDREVVIIDIEVVLMKY